MTTTELAQVTLLRRTADELDRHGWMQGSDGTNDGPKCAAGAMQYVLTGHTSGFGMSPSPEYQVFLATLRTVRRALAQDPHIIDPEQVYDLIDFNDSIGRTKDEVTGLLRRVADQLVAEEP